MTELIWLGSDFFFFPLCLEGEFEEDTESRLCFCGPRLCQAGPDRFTFVTEWGWSGEIVSNSGFIQPVAGLHEGKFLEATCLTGKTHLCVCLFVCLTRISQHLQGFFPHLSAFSCCFCSPGLLYTCTDGLFPLWHFPRFLKLFTHTWIH